MSLLSTTIFLPPQDEEYALQLQLELDMMSDVQDRGTEMTDPLQGEPVANRVSMIMERSYLLGVGLIDDVSCGYSSPPAKYVYIFM